MGHFQKFLALAPKSVETGPVRRNYLNHCQKLIDKGVGFLEKEQAGEAEKAFARVVELNDGHTAGLRPFLKLRKVSRLRRRL